MIYLLSIYLSIYLSTYLSVHLMACLYIYLSISISAYLSTSALVNHRHLPETVDNFTQVSSEDEEMVELRPKISTAPSLTPRQSLVTPALRQSAPQPMPRRSLEAAATSAAASDSAAAKEAAVKRKSGEKSSSSDTQNQRSQVSAKVPRRVWVDHTERRLWYWRDL